jgi:eukaryotic-like serine/threonine-protein kinase
MPDSGSVIPGVPPAPGTVIAGKFALLKQIGAGGVGVVFEAEDTMLRRRVALKVLQAEMAGDPDAVRRFQREASAAASIAHPNIVSVYEAGHRQDGSYYIVQELLEGTDLRRQLDAQAKLPIADVLDILVPIMGALVATHRKDIIHRDIKPENIFLSQSSSRMIPKLIDFGIARMVNKASSFSTYRGTLLGTLYYMSPEQAKGLEVDARGDVWSLAVVMFEMLAGGRPFEAEYAPNLLFKIMNDAPPRITAVAADVPGELADIVHRALEPDLGLRFESMQVFLEAVLGFARRLDPAFGARHAPSIPRYVDTIPPPPDAAELDLVDIRELPVPPITLGRSDRPMSFFNPEQHEDRPLSVPGPDWFAEQALRVNALEEAIAHAEQAITSAHASGDRLGRMRLVQAIACRWLGHYAEAESRALEATRCLPRGCAEWYVAVGHLAMVWGCLGKNDRLVGLAEELRGAEAYGRVSGAHLVAASNLCISLVRAGKTTLAEQVFKGARSTADTLSMSEPAVGAWMDVASAEIAVHSADPTTYLRLVESAVAGFARAGDARNACLQRANIGNAYMQFGAFAKAERVLREAVTVGEPMKLNFIAGASANLGFVLARMGHLPEAFAVETAALAQCVEQGYRRVEAAARVYLAEIYLARGELADAQTQAQRAVAASPGSPSTRAHALAALGGILLRRGMADEALVRAKEAIEILESLEGVEEGEALIRLVHVLALGENGHKAEAYERLAHAQDRLRQRANRISDPLWRRSFLENVPENAQTMALRMAG